MQETVNISQVRPWIRFFARVIDISVFSSLLFTFLPETITSHGFIFSLLLFFLWIFVEAILLSTWGTTLGKWLLKTKVTKSAKKLSFQEAIRRSFMVWWRGLAAGVPFIRLVTMFLACSILKEFKITSWDNDGGYTVSHKKIGIKRIVILALLLLFWLYFATESFYI
jgi:hypothetical protein